MDRLKKAVPTFCMMIVSNVCLSQSRDSIPQKVTAYMADRLRVARVLNLEYSQVAPYGYTSRLLDAALPRGRATDLYQLKLNASVNFIRKQKWTMGLALNYRYTSVTATAKAPASYFYHATSLNFTYYSKLLNKMTIYSGSLLADGSERHFERLKGLLAGTMVLKANRQTKMTAGLVVRIDPSSGLPVLPTFSYEHRFPNGLVADVILPKRVQLRKDILRNGRISMGTELDATSFYLYPDSSSRKYEFRQTELYSGITYEHLLGNAFAVTIRTGVKNVLSARIFEKSASFNSYIFSASPDPAFYFSIGLSFNPFAKAVKRK